MVKKIRGRNRYITMVSYSSGKVTGWLQIRIDLQQERLSAVVQDLYDGTGDQRTSVVLRTSGNGNNVILKSGYAAEKEYYTVLRLEKEGAVYSPASALAYEGNYKSLKEAAEAGAKDISDSLFAEEKGYKTDYSQGGVWFSIFTGISGNAEDGTLESEEASWCLVVTIPEDGSVDTDLLFSGLKDEYGKDVAHYLAGSENDSYGEYNYPTFLVGEDVNLKKLAPVWTDKKQKVYAEGGSTPEISGQSFHDFSKGPVQYTIVSERGRTKNYWVQAVKKTHGPGKLYINSLGEKSSKTYEKDGVIYSTREMILSDWFDYEQNILLVNVGTQEIPD